MINFLKNLFRNSELRSKLLFTLGILLVFRLGSAITIPGVNAVALKAGVSSDGILGLMNLLGGGSLAQFSLFALGVSPYITASIVVELLSMDVIAKFSEWNKEGEVGRKKKDKATRYVAVGLAALQGFSLTYAFNNYYSILIEDSIWSYFYVTIIMISGTMLAMWLGDQITNKGVGNGISLMIFTGIVASLPSQFVTTFNGMVDLAADSRRTIAFGLLNFVGFILAYVLIVVFVIYNEGANRKIAIQYASNSSSMMIAKNETHMPIKINSAGVIPVIFASSVMMTPRTIISFMTQTDTIKAIDKFFDYTQPVGFVVYLVLIVVFAFFYANLQIDAHKISQDLNKNGGYIPGVRTGIETEHYIKKTLNRLTVAGATFLVIIASIPVIIPHIWTSVPAAGMTLGGTGLIIVTGVALETTKQISSQLTRRTYRGTIRK